MNVVTAREIANHVANLIELVSTYHATHDQEAHTTPMHPAILRDLRERIDAEQMDIVHLLDMEARLSPSERFGEWWLRDDVMEISIAKELARMAFDLIGHTAYIESGMGNPQLALSIQRCIAGTLHPATRQELLEVEVS